MNDLTKDIREHIAEMKEELGVLFHERHIGEFFMQICWI